MMAENVSGVLRAARALFLSNMARRASTDRAVAAMSKQHDEEMASLIQASSAGFFAADLDGDSQLTFDEFCHTLPASTRENASDELLREVFTLADADGDGFITRDEWFLWTISWVQSFSGLGGSLEARFRKYDVTGDGCLNLEEATHMMTDIGFPVAAHVVFEELDRNKDGTLCYREIVEELKARKGQYSEEAQRLFTALSFDLEATTRQADEASLTTFSATAPWSVRSVEGLRDAIRRLMAAQQGRPYDVWRALLGHAGTRRKLSREAFHGAIREVLKFTGAGGLLDEAFDAMDDDYSGTLAYDEWLSWMLERPQRRRRARLLTMQSVRNLSEKQLPSVKWSARVLRAELLQLLQRTKLSALDLLHAYDTSEDGLLSKRECLSMFKAVVGNEIAWRGGAKQAALDVHRRYATDNGTVDVEHLQRWLARGNAPVRQRMEAEDAEDATSASTSANKSAPSPAGDGAGAPSEGAGASASDTDGAAAARMPISASLPSLGRPHAVGLADSHLRYPRAHVGGAGVAVPQWAKKSVASLPHLPPAQSLSQLLPPPVAPLAAAGPLPSEALCGHALAARWLLPNATTDDVLKVESDINLPTCLIGGVPRWLVVPPPRAYDAALDAAYDGAAAPPLRATGRRSMGALRGRRRNLAPLDAPLPDEPRGMHVGVGVVRGSKLRAR